MQPFEHIQAIAAPLDRANVDTDQLTPARFMGRIGARADMGSILFNDLRYDADGNERPDFVLNQDIFRNAKVLVTDANFGCGSSRETAVWALADSGFRAVIAPSFGDIFHSNCAKNGLVAIRLSTEECAALRQTLRDKPGTEVSVDLASQTVGVHDGRNEPLHFDFDPFQKTCLIEGLDDIGITLEHSALIEAHETRHANALPWLRRD